jgi:predicted ABC-type ATPase
MSRVGPQFKDSIEKIKLDEINKELKTLIDIEKKNWDGKTPIPPCLDMLGGEAKFYEKARQYIISKGYNIENKLLESGEQPVAIVLVGAPSSGKSTSIKQLMTELRLPAERKDKFVQINADGVMEAIYTIPADLDELPFPCRNLSNKINDFTMKLAKRYKKDLIYDATGKNYYPHSEIIKQLHDDGYEVILCIVMIDKDEIVSRVNKRNEDIKRDVASGKPSRDQTPVDFVMSTYDNILGVIEQYILIPKNIISQIFVYDNSSKGTPTLILKRDNIGIYNCTGDNSKIKLWFDDLDICKETEPRGRSLTTDSDATTIGSDSQEWGGGMFRHIKNNKNKTKKGKRKGKRKTYRNKR